jgi:SAM-dependent methyltransferase
MMSDFYDRLASLYHLIFLDWDASMARQAEQLSDIAHRRWGKGVRSILDVSCGIGTQAIGLARRGFAVTGSDLSAAAIARAEVEAKRRGVEIAFSIGDMRAAWAHHQKQFDLVISCDNAVVHLLTDDAIVEALKQIHACTRPGGGCLLTTRDYDQEKRGTGIVKHFGVREEDGKRYVIFQVWDFEGDIYDLAMYFVVDDGSSGPLVTHVMRSKSYAIGTGQLLELMRQAGFVDTERIDGAFYQPVLVGTRKSE